MVLGSYCLLIMVQFLDDSRLVLPVRVLALIVLNQHIARFHLACFLFAEGVYDVRTLINLLEDKIVVLLKSNFIILNRYLVVSIGGVQLVFGGFYL